MKMETERDRMMKLMSKAIMYQNPNMVIRRLQDDQAFVIYSKAKDESCGNPYYYYILIDVITQKTNPDYFKTINNLIRFHNDLDKGIEIPESYHLRNMFHPLFTRDNKGDILEKLIKFNHREFCTIGTMVVDDYTTKDDVYNLISMLHKCTDFCREHKKISNLDNPHLYDHFKYALATVDKYASEDEVLTKAITENLYGYKINDVGRAADTGYFASISSNPDKILIKHQCPSCKDFITNPGDFTLYYTGVLLFHQAIDVDKKIVETTREDKYRYLKGEYVYHQINFNDPNRDKHSNAIFEKYLIPILWFDFENVNYVNTKLTNIRCDNCGKSLVVIG